MGLKPVRISFQGQYTEAQLRAMLDGFGGRALRRAAGRFTVLAAGAALACLLLGLRAAATGSRTGAMQWTLLALLPLAIAAWNVRALRRSRDVSLAAGSHIGGALADDGIEISQGDNARKIPWSDIEDYEATQDALHLRWAGRGVIALPRELFPTAQELDLAVALTRRSIVRPPPPPAKPTVDWKAVGIATVAIVVAVVLLVAFSLLTRS